MVSRRSCSQRGRPSTITSPVKLISTNIAPLAHISFKITELRRRARPINNIQIIQGDISHIASSAHTLKDDIEWLGAYQVNLGIAPLVALGSSSSPQPVKWQKIKNVTSQKTLL